MTPILENPNTQYRSREIQKWLDECVCEIESFVILDDEWEMGPFTKSHFVKCQGHNGITSEVKIEAVRILNNIEENK